MTDQNISPRDVLKAFEALGKAVGGYDEIEIVLVGGMAGCLGGWFPTTQTTHDCDVVYYDPEHVLGNVEMEASKIARKYGLPPTWLNCAARNYQWVLPEGWKDRVVPVAEYGLLKVSHIGRMDFIAMKVFASRDSDRNHLLSMGVTELELCSSENHLDRLVEIGASADRIEQARNTIKILRAKS